MTALHRPNGGQWQIGKPMTTGYKASSDSLGEAIRSMTVTTPAGTTRYTATTP